MSIREEIEAMDPLGPLPSEDSKDVELMKKYDKLYRSITPPGNRRGSADIGQAVWSGWQLGMASSLMHLIETSPGWPLKDCLGDLDNEWIVELRNRAIRGGRL